MGYLRRDSEKDSRVIIVLYTRTVGIYSHVVVLSEDEFIVTMNESHKTHRRLSQV